MWRVIAGLKSFPELPSYFPTRTFEGIKESYALGWYALSGRVKTQKPLNQSFALRIRAIVHLKSISNLAQRFHCWRRSIATITSTAKFKVYRQRSAARKLLGIQTSWRGGRRTHYTR
jgi:hypothetical protein